MSSKPTDYANSRATGETPWGITTYDYTPASREFVRPAPTVVARSDRAGYNGPDPATMPTLLIKVDVQRNEVSFPGRNIKPIRYRLGKRTVLSVRDCGFERGNCKRPRLRVIYACDCGGTDSVRLEDYRKSEYGGGGGGTQCRVCAMEARRLKGPRDPQAYNEAQKLDRLTQPAFYARKER